jgi:hypothetical protein
MVDERFEGVIKWDKAGEAMVIDDFQLFWSMGTSQSPLTLTIPLHRLDKNHNGTYTEQGQRASSSCAKRRSNLHSTSN